MATSLNKVAISLYNCGMATVAQMLAALPHDAWRETHPFSADLLLAQQALWETTDDARAAEILEEWLSVHQPCLFGRIAAKSHLLRFCFLRESDLLDEMALRSMIQTSRTRWKRDGWSGDAHGFLIVLLSANVAMAAPSKQLLSLASAIASAYLLVQVIPGEIYLDQLCYEFNLPDRPVLQWPVGVNYFCANADGRWWHDHRIPGGLAFSMNSAGHMAAAGKAKDSIEELSRTFGFDTSGLKAKVTSLGEVLMLAMQTIKGATKTSSGSATSLIKVSDDKSASIIRCPVVLPKSIAEYSHCNYQGWYNTDVTLPELYFSPEAERPPQAKSETLDLTYLHLDEISNPDFLTMGEGLRIRDDVVADDDRYLKWHLANRFIGEKVEAADAKRIRGTLGI